MNKIVILFVGVVLLLISVRVKSQEYYWVGFSYKNQTSFSFDEPEKYLSERAIQRRIRQNIPIDSLDLPVNLSYIQQVTDLGVELVHASKWLNGITIKSEIDSFSYKVSQLPFVKEVELTKPDVMIKSTFNKFNEIEGVGYLIDTVKYGPSAYQLELMNGQYLHNQNYLGQGMQIAVLDAGFYNADIYSAFDSLWANNQILGTKDFVDPDANVFNSHYHGMSVLSCMGGNVPGELIGTAPKASYWLLRSEDGSSEYLIEEDNWVVAAEFADSVGCDIINSSLGYSNFLDPEMDHTYADMDGKTTRVTRGANIAFTRGMLVFSSAGNEGQKSWKHIVAPSDGDNVISVGAVNRDSVPAAFTSVGPASDGDVKPNVAGVGWNTYLTKSSGDLGYLNGTSFSSPVIAGITACLWQANLEATAAEIKTALEMSSHQYNNPDSFLGYGIPDMSRAISIVTNLSVELNKQDKKWFAYPNPATETLFLLTDHSKPEGDIRISIFSMDGKLLHQEIKSWSQKIELHNFNSLPTGILLLKVESKGEVEAIKISKM